MMMLGSICWFMTPFRKISTFFVSKIGLAIYPGGTLQIIPAGTSSLRVNFSMSDFAQGTTSIQ
jgi:hypothetical protein